MRKLTFKQQQRLLLAGTVALFAIIPLRHVIFDNDGRAAGFFFWWMVLRRTPRGHWSPRPAYADRKTAVPESPSQRPQPI